MDYHNSTSVSRSNNEIKRQFLNSYTPTPTSMEMSHLTSTTLPLLDSNPDSPDDDKDIDELYISVNGNVPISQPHHRNRTITTG